MHVHVYPLIVIQREFTCQQNVVIFVSADYLETFTDLDKAIDNTLLSLPESKNEQLPVAPAQPEKSEQAQAFEQQGKDRLSRPHSPTSVYQYIAYY